MNPRAGRWISRAPGKPGARTTMCAVALGARLWLLSTALLAFSTAAQSEYEVTLCHVPPGNPGNAHVISVAEDAVSAHLAHGDRLGICADTCPPSCYEGTEVSCVDAVDNDCDGAVDAADPDCFRCGDQVVQPGEQCDDGNDNPFDGCDRCIAVDTTPD